MTEALKPSEVLDRAAALIEPEGAWTQENWWDGPGTTSDTATCWCAEGAICRASHRRYSTDVALTKESDYLRRVLGIEFYQVPEWNDTKGRTQPEVVAALRKAAELAREEGQ